jgi:hypothetical protein
MQADVPDTDTSNETLSEHNQPNLIQETHPMNKFILATALIIGTASTAFAYPSDLTGKATSDLLGASNRSVTATANPTANPQSGSLTDKAMRDAPGVVANGRTTNPTAKPQTGSLTDKAAMDLLGS